MDFTKLRAAALKDGDDEEAVTVNTRALIDKVLARYSGEWTTLRELIQNAADAQASKVIIKFETLPSVQVPIPNTTNRSESLKHVLLHHTLRRLLVTNNGQPFGVNDWNRLKRIAEGNPDETKIGAFGVGFYSVFADCEEPFVSSGNEAMAFYWKANSLFTRRLQLPAEQGNPDTSFVLDYRNTTTPMPNLLSIAQFLATSLTFVALQHLELWVDDWKIISLQKKTAPSIQVPIARDIETKTKEGLMQVRSMERESVQMDATFMNVVGWKPTASPNMSSVSYGNNSDVPSLRSFFSRLTNSSSQAQQKTKAMQEAKAMQEIVLEDLTATTTANVFLRVTTADIKTSINSQFATELERATKKPPPKTTKLAILTSSYDETTASTEGNSVAKHVDIFASVLPSKKPGGRIFIGFPTHQTTGAGIHLSAPSVIPTVERESIDLNARWVRTWNIEMLRVAGIMTRLAFISEMAELSAKVLRATELAGRGTKVSKEQIDHFMPEALHTINTFTFGDSTPSSQVAQIINDAFWTAYKKPTIEVYSSRGVLPTTKVRLAVEDLSGFVEGVPVIPNEFKDSRFIAKLKDFGLITEITHQDVKQELGAKALNSTQLTQLVTWAAKKAIKGEMDINMIRSLFDVVIATVGDIEGQGDIIALAAVTNYLNINKLPSTVPIPPTTIPFKFTKEIQINELHALGWEPLEVIPWLRFLIESNTNREQNQDLTTSVPFAATVLHTLSKAWEQLSFNSRATVASLLQDVTIIPTKFGMRKPGEAYFPNVKLFDDLPTVTSLQGVKEKFLLALGVRKTVDLETIFKRLLSPDDNKRGQQSSNAAHVELVKYLASVKDDIPATDLQKLKGTPICPAEAGPKGMESTIGSSRLYKVSELFEPSATIRALQLPIIQWPGPPGSFRSSSVEGRFLSLLGLRKIPTVPELVDMMASPDVQLRNNAMTYYISSHYTNEYGSFSIGSTQKRFLPLAGEVETLVSPAECFTNEKCAVLGFNILHNNLKFHASKFGVAIDPPMTECVNRLIANPPRSKTEAVTLFEYFASRLAEIGSNNVEKIGDAKIVPLQGQQSGAHTEKALLPPRECYLGASSTYKDIFNFVDFGRDANVFLLKCGSKQEPTKPELAALACKEPARLLGILQTPEKYLGMLMTLAEDLPALKKDKTLLQQMKTSKFLLGSVEIPGDKEKKGWTSGFGNSGNEFEDDLEDTSIKQYQLVTAKDVVINDDYISYQLFKKSLICAPADDKLEQFYIALGAALLSDQVEETHRLGSVAQDQKLGLKLRSHVLERSKLFLHQFSPDNIKHDARWLEKNLTVQVVASIDLRRTLKGHGLTSTQSISALLTHSRRTGAVLYTTNDTDWFHISQSVCRVLLERPTQQTYITFESFLKLTLRELRHRGYNVERILRAKEAQQRIAEEERKKQHEAEQQQIREQERLWREQNQAEKTPTKDRSLETNPIPGAFGSDSPEGSPESDRGRGGLFSRWGRRLGIDRNSQAQEQLQNFLGGGSSQNPPPPQQDPSLPTYDQVTKPPKTEKVSSPAALQQNLVNAIQSSRAHNSNSVFSAPTQNIIKEQASYCDSTPGQNITYLADASNGMRIFISKDLHLPTSSFLADNISGLNTFATLLYEISDVYNLPRKAMHIYYDENGSTIAFNLNGSIFANFRFFKQLHQKKMEPPGVIGTTVGEGCVEAAAYWWTVVAHELAHNLVKPHNSEHSFYTEMLMSNYFSKMMTKASGFLGQHQQGTENVSLMD
ncbi:hypothetical protein B0O99DRAFT_609126 [Bisporella sp. PMI_857]|nr:hypothetical protein B0O99DRAFT_609126 [Bisporella sp. PMI_857]